MGKQQDVLVVQAGEVVKVDSPLSILTASEVMYLQMISMRALGFARNIKQHLASGRRLNEYPCFPVFAPQASM